MLSVSSIARQNARDASPVRLALRVTWFGLAAIHAVPLLSLAARLIVHPTWESACSLVALATVFGLFTLKALNTPCLRTHRPGREFFIWLLAGALAHGDIATQAGALDPETRVVLVAATACVTLGQPLRRRLARDLEVLGSSLRSVIRLFPRHAAVGYVWSAAATSGNSRTVLAHFARPPPAL